jgi:hypothetical protein
MTLIDESFRSLVQGVAAQLVFLGQRRASGRYAVRDTPSTTLSERRS